MVRKLTEEDLTSALILVKDVFDAFEAPDYSEEGINAFYDFIKDEAVYQKLKNGEMQFWGAFCENRMVGVIAIRNKNHISLLFVDGKHHRKGIGKALFEQVKLYVQSRGLKEITVHSSPYAIPVYHKLGFIDTDRELISNGIRFTPMQFSL